MPDNPPPTYRWAVSVTANDVALRTIEAAYPVPDDGYMILKDSAHKIVFAAAPGTGCTFRRGELASPGAAAPPIAPVKLPDGCACTYTWWFGVEGVGRVSRNVSWSCTADHTEIDRHAGASADSDRSVVAEADAARISRGIIPRSEIREMRHGLGEPGDDGARL